MNPLPSIASSNIANLLTRNLPTTTHHRYIQLVIGDNPIALTAPPTSVDTPPVVASPATVDTAPTVVVSAIAATSDSVPPLVPTIIHPNPVPYLVDTGASFPIAQASASDFTPLGLIHSAASVVFKTKVASKAYTSKSYSTPVDPYTLITGEDVSVSVDLTSPDTTIDSDSVDTFEFASTLDHFDI